MINLTICVPIYNEEASLRAVANALLNIELPIWFEIFFVDDGSTDQTATILNEISKNSQSKNVRIISHETNLGKGAAVRSGLSLSSGDYFLIFDSDTEYLVSDIRNVVEQVSSGRAKSVLGVRMPGYYSNFPSIMHVIGNRVMTNSVNVLFGTWITDVHTCLKLAPTDLLRGLNLKESGFGLDIEIVAKMLRGKHKIYEVPISYLGRTKEEGKKIRLSDAFVFYKVLLTERFRYIPRKKYSYDER